MKKISGVIASGLNLKMVTLLYKKQGILVVKMKKKYFSTFFYFAESLIK